MPSGVKDIQLLELKDTISQLNKTISTQNELISSLQKMLEERNAKDSEKDLLIANLQSQLAYLKNKVFGSTSEIRHDQLDGQLNLFGTPVGDEKPAEVIEPEVISVKGYTKERKPKATYDDKYNSVRSICKHFFTDIVGLSIKFFCVSLRHMSILPGDIEEADNIFTVLSYLKLMNGFTVLSEAVAGVFTDLKNLVLPDYLGVRVLAVWNRIHADVTGWMAGYYPGEPAQKDNAG